MTIQFNTANNINGSEAMNTRLSSIIADKLSRFDEYITRIEAHLSDENGGKEGENDKRCTLEARPQGKQPIVVTNNADTYDEAVAGAVTKLKSALDSAIGKLKAH
jgi:ribosome-associated translation inhibitor RaiA